MATDDRVTTQAHARTKVDRHGRILIPAEIRERMGLQAGDEVALTLEDGSLRLRTPEEAMRSLQALVARLNPEGKSLVDALIRERREAAARGE